MKEQGGGVGLESWSCGVGEGDENNSLCVPLNRKGEGCN
jgi:hypothetical protein